MRAPRSPPRRSDIIIGPDGELSISFLWEDLRSLRDQGWSGRRDPGAPAIRPARPILPRIRVSPAEYSHCTLCPIACGSDRTRRAHPRCGDHRLRIATAGISLGDEPCLAGKCGSGVVMLSGCPLRCPSCHNPEMVAGGPPVSASRLVAMAWDFAERGAHNLQILSPTVHLPAIRAVARALKSGKFPLPIVLKSSGYESVAALRTLEGLVDVYVPDCKFGTRSQWAKKAGAPDYLDVLQGVIAEMFRQVGPVRFARGILKRGVLVRHVRAPLPESELREIDQFLSSLPEGIEVARHDHFDRLG